MLLIPHDALEGAKDLGLLRILEHHHQPLNLIGVGPTTSRSLWEPRSQGILEHLPSALFAKWYPPGNKHALKVEVALGVPQHTKLSPIE